MEDKEMKGVKAKTNISQFLQTLKLNLQILGLGQECCKLNFCKRE